MEDRGRPLVLVPEMVPDCPSDAYEQLTLADRIARGSSRETAV